MKILQRVFSFLFAVMIIGQVSAQNYDNDIINRLGFYSVKQCRMSVEQLKKDFPSAYPPAKDWAKTLDALEENGAAIISRIKSGDQQAVKEAEKLLVLIDAIFNENPLIKGKRIAGVRRELGDKARNATGDTLGVGPSNYQNNSELARHGWTNQLVTIVVDGSKKEQKTLYTPSADVLISYPEPNSDGERVLFSSIGTNDRRHLFELEFAACTAYKNYESVRIIDNANKYDDWVPRDTVFNDGGFISEQVGRYRRSPWELFDMQGNVCEWTLSKYKPYPYNDDDGRNEATKDEVSQRVVRGGSWYDRPFRATSSYRLSYRDYQKVFNVGFRVVMVED